MKNRLIVRGAREHNLPVNRRTPQQIVDDLLGQARRGPEGGPNGGMIVAEGTPEQVASAAESRTGQFLRVRLAGESRHWARAARSGAVTVFLTRVG